MPSRRVVLQGNDGHDRIGGLNAKPAKAVSARSRAWTGARDRVRWDSSLVCCRAIDEIAVSGELPNERIDVSGTAAVVAGVRDSDARSDTLGRRERVRIEWDSWSAPTAWSS
jgi:hypothetical protein